MTRTASRIVFALSLLILAGGVVTLSAVLLRNGQNREITALGGPFRLIDQSGRGVDEKVLVGKPTILFFGYTHCPDICPTRLYEMAQFVAMLGPEGGRLNVVFASIDPERDTPALLKDYLAGFNDRFIGLTGSPEAVAAFAKAWRAFYRKVANGSDNYTMDHTAALYLLDKKGQFVALIDIERAPDKASAMVKTLL